MCRDGGSIIDYDKEVDGGVVTSEDVAWLYGSVPSWFSVRWWGVIWKVHQSMGNDSRVTDELYVFRGWLTLENVQFSNLFSLCFTEKQMQLGKYLRLLSCPDSSKHPLSPFVMFDNITSLVINIIYTRPHLLQLSLLPHLVRTLQLLYHPCSVHHHQFHSFTADQSQPNISLHLWDKVAGYVGCKRSKFLFEICYFLWECCYPFSGKANTPITIPCQDGLEGVHSHSVSVRDTKFDL
jgi:hypothetical protein